MIGVDLIGPFKASSRNGNRYCLTATDFFTKWVEAIPIQDKTAAATSQALMDIFHTHGAPEVILTDQGREFWNKVNVQASTNYSPYRLMYGREPRLSSEITGDIPPLVEVDGIDEDTVADYLQARAEKDEEVFDKVRLNVEKAQEKKRETYRRRIKKGTKCFKILPGMEVLKKDERKRGRLGRTMDPDWPTQYRVTEVGDNNLVQLETLDGHQLKTQTPYASVKPLEK
ncbi:hypothetical protein AAFF_G00013400 [Aldrovandia affinis]|uniref:Integrase catalytic domain-containing protein n=1 Tax=Aldrovandia affinis TaxID=143900 RepID=A0AAD7R2M1_9TELE|nr:hypothetical protein AAFF_G00013400 [Aldrovandia affinis]